MHQKNFPSDAHNRSKVIVEKKSGKIEPKIEVYIFIRKIRRKNSAKKGNPYYFFLPFNSMLIFFTNFAIVKLNGRKN